MNRIIVVLIVLFSLNSCASIINTEYTQVKLYSKQDSVKVSSSNCDGFSYTPAKLIVKRSKEDLRVQLAIDSVKKEVFIPSKLSTVFWAGNLFSPAIMTGYLIDLTNQKRYTYPRSVYFDFDSLDQINFRYRTLTDSEKLSKLSEDVGFNRFYSATKGEMKLRFSVPEANFMHFRKGRFMESTGGFLGFTGEFDYYYADKKYIGLGAGAVINFIVPVPVPYSPYGEYEKSKGYYLDFICGVDVRRISFRGGIHAAKYSYYKRFAVYDMVNKDSYDSYKLVAYRMGVSLSSVFKLSKHFNCGLHYKPSFYTVDSNEYTYGHLIFFDIALNFNL
jgi:hypothetical protein